MKKTGLSHELVPPPPVPLPFLLLPVKYVEPACAGRAYLPHRRFGRVSYNFKTGERACVIDFNLLFQHVLFQNSGRITSGPRERAKRSEIFGTASNLDKKFGTWEDFDQMTKRVLDLEIWRVLSENKFGTNNLIERTKFIYK